MVASLYYVGRTLYGGVRDLALGEVAIRWVPLAGALALTTVCVGLGGWLWQLVLRSLGVRLGLGECLTIQTTSNLAKYLPGYAWQLVGKGYLTAQQAPGGGRMGLALLLELGALLGTAGFVALASWPADVTWPWLGRPTVWVRGVGAGVLALLLLGAAPLVRGALRWVEWRRPAWAGAVLGSRSFYGALGVAALSWGVFGAAYALTVGALVDLPPADWPLALHTLTLSFIVSLLTPFVPGGIGVREGLMAYLLASRLPGGVAALAAVLSRLLLVASELAAFGLLRAWGALRRHNG